MKLLITGGTGYIGAHLADHLSNHGFDVTITARNPQNNLKIKNILLGDITDDALFDKIRSQKFDAIIHTVSLNHNYGEAHWDEAFEVGVNSTYRLLETAQACGTTKFIYFSTQQVYGAFSANKDYNEDVPANPVSVYGLTHWTSENICKFFSAKTGIKTLSLRLSNALGKPIVPSPHIDSLVTNDLCRMAKAQGEIRLKSDGTPQRNFILMGDIKLAVEKILKCYSWPHDVVNLGSPMTITLAELAQMISESAGNVPVFLVDGTRLNEVKEFQAMKKFSYPIERLKDFGISLQSNLSDGISELLT